MNFQAIKARFLEIISSADKKISMIKSCTLAGFVANLAYQGFAVYHTKTFDAVAFGTSIGLILGAGGTTGVFEHHVVASAARAAAQNSQDNTSAAAAAAGDPADSQ